jgi:hypothetical protein
VTTCPTCAVTEIGRHCFACGALRCYWCDGDPAYDEYGPDGLCEGHVAEYEGMSVVELRRMLSEQYAEWRDAVYG